jgi:hypothetical protein
MEGIERELKKPAHEVKEEEEKQNEPNWYWLCDKADESWKEKFGQNNFFLISLRKNVRFLFRLYFCFRKNPHPLILHPSIDVPTFYGIV